MDNSVQNQQTIGTCPNCEMYFSFRPVDSDTCLYCPNCSFVVQVSPDRNGSYRISVIDDPESLGIPIQNPNQKKDHDMNKNNPITNELMQLQSLQGFPTPQPNGYVPGTSFPIMPLHEITASLRGEVYRIYSENMNLRRKLHDVTREVEEYKSKKKRRRKSKKDRAAVQKIKIVPDELFTKWGEAIKRKVEGMKFFQEEDGKINTQVNIKEKIGFDEFKQIFDGKGELIQPTQHCKPRSQVWVIRFDSFEKIEELFGKDRIDNSGISASEWTRTDTSTKKKGPVVVSIKSLDVSYSKNKSELTLKFSCCTE
eukprot:TRINITY_DN3004_c0_g1_i1.p1 TRINITY_DN3004_c0_g1~~TRINITY_DN3004_c0_g1_i1.p1  ORF type:complete len:311 (-),score=52.47 TRINITY_DN3004_c0_g1_i1:43-975(-)